VDDADRLAVAIDHPAVAHTLPQRLLELAAVAAELAEVLAAPVLTESERARIHSRARRLARRRFGLWVPRPALLAGAAGGAAVTLAVVGLALLRGRPPAGYTTTEAVPSAA